MSLFCIIAFDGPHSTPKREQHLEAHISNLKKLKQAGKLLAAGPLLKSEDEASPEQGSMLIVDFENQQQAEAWYKNDAYYLAGVYASLQVIPYLDAMPYLE
ncbi:MAG: hypothetical protein K0R14_308 [Burkholderiales bacterium]|jgi:uncharacterized protein YciI|nr:hypothetical protein [Burkholderiales bacterium]